MHSKEALVLLLNWFLMYVFEAFEVLGWLNTTIDEVDPSLIPSDWQLKDDDYPHAYQKIKVEC